MDLDKIYTEDIKQHMEGKELSSTRQRRWEQRFQWLCVPRSSWSRANFL